MAWTEPSAEAYAAYSEIAAEINRHLYAIDHDPKVMYSSSHNSTREHPHFKALVEMGDRIIPYLFHVLTHRGASWTILLLLHQLVPDENPIRDGHEGCFYGIIHDWLGWFLNSKYRERDDIYAGLVDEDKR
jgi:hypothetical protein